MARWLWMTGGLVVWLIQFSGLYALSSLADVVDRPDGFGWRMAGLGFSVVCALVCVGLLVLALRRRGRREPVFIDDIAAMSAAIGLVSVIFQGAPVLIGY